MKTSLKALFIGIFYAFLCVYTTNIVAQCDEDIVIDFQVSVDSFSVWNGCSIIEGSLVIKEIFGTSPITNLDGLNGITSIEGNLRIEDISAINLNGLQNLSSIGGNLIIERNYYLTTLNGLQNLSSIGGSLIVEGNNALTNIDGLQNVYDVGEDLIIGGSLIVGGHDVLANIDGLQNISSIAGDLTIFNTNALTNIDGLENISSVGGSLLVGSNDVLINIDGLQNIFSVGADLKISQNDVLTNIDSLINLSSIGEDLLIYNNSILTNIDGLANLSSIGENLIIQSNASLNSIDGLANLSTIGGSENLDGWIIIEENASLPNLNGLENLSSIEGALEIVDNDMLTNIDGLENISSVGSYLKIQYNDILTNIDGLVNVDTVMGNLQVWSNPMLSTCCFFIGLNIIDGDIHIFGNLPSCNSMEAIVYHCNYQEIQVQAFFDENENGIFDDGEKPMYESFNLEPSAIYSFSDDYGVGHLFLEEFGVYQLSINNLHPLWTINGPDIIQIEFLDNPFTDTLYYFPLIPDAEFTIQNIDIASSITRCNRETNYWLSYTNQGTTINSGYVELIPDELTTFVSANPPVDSIAGDTLYWFYEDLYPTHTNQIHLVYEMPGVAEFGEEIIGDEIVFEAVTQVETEAGGKIGRKTISSELVCAYDPNDKLVNPSGYGNENYTLFGDTLEYTVRFQNTGNDTAFTVVIEDELSEYLDLKTFRPIASSHDVRTQIDLETRIATFAFNDIYLPDSFVNEVASHGFVKYRILSNEGLAENTKIENTASIFFDFNPAIVTNTVSNQMVSVLPALPVMSASPNELNFGEIPLDESSYLPQTLVINNTGDLPLEIENFDFGNTAFNSGEIQTATIEGQNSLEVPIYFAPDEEGTYESELVLQSNVGNLSIVLNGTAILNTGLNTISNTSIKVFPNPNQGQFYLDAKGGKIVSYQIYNVLGEVILSEKSITDFTLIDMQKQSKGVYFLSIETEEGIFVEKIIVQ